MRIVYEEHAPIPHISLIDTHHAYVLLAETAHGEILVLDPPGICAVCQPGHTYRLLTLAHPRTGNDSTLSGIVLVDVLKT